MPATATVRGVVSGGAGAGGTAIGLAALNGTGYAAGYVAGVAALVRSKYPDLSATAVADRSGYLLRTSAATPAT
ncbi:hypothetical protein JHV675_51500 [Mycobacterium avium subsp. hominissuis]